MVHWARAVAVQLKGNSPTQDKVYVKDQKELADGVVGDIKNKRVEEISEIWGLRLLSECGWDVMFYLKKSDVPVTYGHRASHPKEFSYVILFCVPEILASFVLAFLQRLTPSHLSDTTDTGVEILQ